MCVAPLGHFYSSLCIFVSPDIKLPSFNMLSPLRGRDFRVVVIASLPEAKRRVDGRKLHKIDSSKSLTTAVQGVYLEDENNKTINS